MPSFYVDVDTFGTVDFRGIDTMIIGMFRTFHFANGSLNMSDMVLKQLYQLSMGFGTWTVPIYVFSCLYPHVQAAP